MKYMYIYCCCVELSGVLEAVGVSRQSLERVCEDDTFLAAIKVMKPYADVAPCLGVTRQKVAAIKGKRVSEETKSLDMLRYWKNKEGTGATHLALVKGLLKAEDHTTAEAVAAHVRDISKPMAVDGYNVSLEEAVDRYPNWDRMTPAEREEAKKQVAKKNFEMQMAYSALLVQLCTSYIQCNAPPSMIKLCLQGHLTRLIHESTSCSTPDPQDWLYQDLSKAKTISDIFDVLSRHTSWFNFLLLEIVVNGTGIDSEKSLFKAYTNEQLVSYLECSVFEIPSKATNSDSVPLYLKVPDDIQLNGNNVQTIQAKLEELFHVPSLEFQQASNGCIQLMFSIPKALFECYPVKSSLHHYIEWEETVEGYMITADIVQIL